ncbi:MAG: PD-(D/E)XK nuclease family protein [Treponema sp.]
MENKENYEIRELLSFVGKIVEKNNAIQDERRKRGEFFNIFDVLNVRSHEVRLHSAFIAELLNPEGSHGLGDKFLQAFLKENKIEDFNTSGARVFIEKFVGHIDEDYEEGGRIDILIESSCRKYAIAIENKIYAGDQYNQLLRYKNYLEKTLKLESSHYKLLYLTLDGKEPQNYSSGNAEKAFWENISYRECITNWLSRCVQIATAHPLIRETLNQYLNLIKELTYQTLEEEMSEELTKILMEGNNLKYAQELSNGIDNAKNRIMEERIIPKIKELKKDIKLNVEISNSLKEKWGEFWFTKDSWKNKNICVSFVFESSMYRYLSVGIYKIDEKEWNKQFFDKLTEIEGNLFEEREKNIESNCAYWTEVEDISYYDGMIPIECFTEPDKFIEKVKTTLLKLAKAIDEIIASFEKDV